MSSHESATDALLCEPAGPVGSAQATVRLGCLRFVPSAHPIMRFALQFPIDMLSGQALLPSTQAGYGGPPPTPESGRPQGAPLQDDGEWWKGEDATAVGRFLWRIKIHPSSLRVPHESDLSKMDRLRRFRGPYRRDQLRLRPLSVRRTSDRRVRRTSTISSSATNTSTTATLPPCAGSAVVIASRRSS